MVEIKIDQKLESNIRKMYTTKRFYVDIPKNNSATSNNQTLQRTQVSLVAKLKHEMMPFVNANNPAASQSILEKFLRHYFEDPSTKDEISLDQIENYIFSKDTEKIIEYFWKIVQEDWTSKVSQTGNQPAATAFELCKWNSEQEYASADDKDGWCTLKGTITPSIRPFVEISNTSSSQKTRFVHHKDLYGASGALTVLSKIFSYGKLTDNFRHELMVKLPVPVCPYCNRQYITSYKSTDRDKTLADLDHFYCKSRYPFLAISFFNFVPGCQICNQRFKSAVDFYVNQHINPHKDSFGSKARFRLVDPTLLLDEAAWNAKTGPIVEIRSSDPVVTNSINTFHLNDVYQSHREVVREIILKSKAYNQDMITCVRKEFPTLFDTDQEIQELIFGQPSQEIEAVKRPLAKLT